MHYTDSVIATVAGGASQVQRNIVAGQLGLQAGVRDGSGSAGRNQGPRRGIDAGRARTRHAARRHGRRRHQARAARTATRPAGSGPREGTDSGVFVGVNRNKRSVAVDLDHTGRAGRCSTGCVGLGRRRRGQPAAPGAAVASAWTTSPCTRATRASMSVSVSTFGVERAVRRPSRHRPGGPGAQRVDGRHRLRRRRPGEGRPAGGRRDLLAARRVRRDGRAVGAGAHRGGPAGRGLADRRAGAHPGAVHRPVLPARHPAAAHRQRDRLVRAVQRLPLRGRPVRAPRLLQRQVLPQPLRGAWTGPDLATDERFVDQRGPGERTARSSTRSSRSSWRPVRGRRRSRRSGHTT